ncbi:MAG: hypothetical protein AB8G11_12675 [Saprospiraceae bacterium]
MKRTITTSILLLFCFVLTAQKNGKLGETSLQNAKKTTLHLLAFGTNPPDLKYTENDARDFSNLFKNQDGSNGLFKQVNLNLLR